MKKLPPLRITESVSGDPTSSFVVPTSSAEVQRAHEVRMVTVDERRVLPYVPELFRFPVNYVHEHPMVQRAGGLPLIVEGIAELLPGIRFDRPETIPPPARAVMRALHKRSAFGLVIIVEPKAWWVDLHSGTLKRLPDGR